MFKFQKKDRKNRTVGFALSFNNRIAEDRFSKCMYLHQRRLGLNEPEPTVLDTRNMNITEENKDPLDIPYRLS